MAQPAGGVHACPMAPPGTTVTTPTGQGVPEGVMEGVGELEGLREGEGDLEGVAPTDSVAVREA